MKYFDCVVALIFLLSCFEQNVDGFHVENYLYSLDLSSTYIEAGPLMNEMSVIVTSNVTWCAETLVPWIMIDTCKGDGNREVSFIITKNLTNKDRMGYIRIYHENYVNRYITILQKACVVFVSNDSLFAEPKGGNVDLFVESNGEWFVENSNAWITASCSNGIKDAKLSIYLSENISMIGRVASLYIRDQVGNKKKLTIEQHGCQFHIDEKDFFLLKFGKQKIVQYNCNCDFEIVVEHNDWLSTSIMDECLILEPQPNLSGNRRWVDAFVKLRGIEEYVDTLFINQGYYDEPLTTELLYTIGFMTLTSSGTYATSNLGGNLPEAKGHSFTYNSVYTEEELLEIKKIYQHKPYFTDRYDAAKLLIGEGWRVCNPMILSGQYSQMENINGIKCMRYGNLSNHFIYIPCGIYWPSSSFYCANRLGADYVSSLGFISNDMPMSIRVCIDN